MAAVSEPEHNPHSLARKQYFGTAITPLTFPDWLDTIDQILERGQRRQLSGHHNLHSLYVLQRDAQVRGFYQRCDSCYIDGMPVRLILRGCGIATTASQRFTLMDEFPALLQQAQQRNWKLFYLGSAPQVVERAKNLITAAYPRLRIEMHHGYDADNPAVIASINRWQPDLLLVGMGMPVQERWLMSNLEQLDVGVATECGATLDYFTGFQAKPPVWLSGIGLGWLYRLVADPKRLWRRYLLEPWALIPTTVNLWRSARAAK